MSRKGLKPGETPPAPTSASGDPAQLKDAAHQKTVERLLNSRDFAETMLRLIDRDPLTALHISSEHGLVVYANDQAARMFLGQGVRAVDAMGLTWGELFPAPLADERLAIVREIVQDREPRYVRSIYYGHQVIARYDCIGPLPGVANGDNLFLCVTRHEPRTIPSGSLDHVRVVEPRTNYLGPLAKLTPRELELLALVAEGRTITEIAEALNKSIHTVNEQRRSLGRKLGAQDRVALAELARDAGLKRADARLANLEHLAQPLPATSGPPTSPERLREVAFSEPRFVHTLWRALNNDPFTAFQVLLPDSTILHANMNVVRMFVPELGDVHALLGKKYSDVAPMELVRDRMDFIRSVAGLRKPRMMRSIYQSIQTITRMEYCAPVDGVSAGNGLVVVAARHTPADVVARLPAHVRRLITTPNAHRLGVLAELSPREREVLALTGEGLSNRQIAQSLHRTEDTVEDHRQSIGKKLRISDRVKLAELARQSGLTVDDADMRSVDSLHRRH
ncbi:MAG: LuxR C-terminal-related transcriptional regulator [Phycisphaerales bacterium]